MNRILISIMLCFGCVTITAQTATEILGNYIDHKKIEQQYQVNVRYALYKGKDDKKVYESYEGFLAKRKHVLYQKLGTMELAQGEDFIVKLNSEEKAMLVGYASKPIFNSIDQLDNEMLLKLFNEKTLEDHGEIWKIILTSNASELSQFSTIELYLRKSDLNPVKQIFHYNTVSDFSAYKKNAENSELGNPRLEITYNNYSKDLTLNRNVFERSRYFIYRDNKILATDEFKNYEILHAN